MSDSNNELCLALARLRRELPGWWWRIGECSVSCDATVGPDLAGPDRGLLVLSLFDRGFDCDLRQPSTVAAALNGAIDTALKARVDAMAAPEFGALP